MKANIQTQITQLLNPIELSLCALFHSYYAKAKTGHVTVFWLFFQPYYPHLHDMH